MASFFEKLKKGMGAGEPVKEEIPAEPGEKIKEKEKTEEPAEAETPLEKPAEKPKKRSRPAAEKKEPAQEKKPIQAKVEKQESKKIETMEQKEETIKTSAAKTAEEKQADQSKWSSFGKEPEGQLAMDVYQTEEELVLQSAIAGVKPDSIDISIEGDMVTVRGNREKPQEEENANYFYQECFWGPFSRQIILSVEVDPSRTEASLKDGILTIRMPKIERERKRKIMVKG
jgi:HSP20 family protein